MAKKLLQPSQVATGSDKVDSEAMSERVGMYIDTDGATILLLLLKSSVEQLFHSKLSLSQLIARDAIFLTGITSSSTSATKC